MGAETSRSWFCVLNNPTEHGFQGTPEEIVNTILEYWCTIATRTAIAAYCISAKGLHHVHFVVCDSLPFAFGKVKKAYPMAHIEPMKGTKKQALDYIYKRGVFEEKGEEIVVINNIGEVKDNQGHRSDFDDIEVLLLSGKTPKEILSEKFSYYKYEKMIKQAYYDKRLRETPLKRDIEVIVHTGESGTGKSYCMTTLNENEFYLMTDYKGGGLDAYNGEPTLFMDEFRGQIPYNELLTMLNGYKAPVHARYTNAYCLWNTVHITSVIPPDEWYKNDNIRDTYEQLRRRITKIVYHWKDENGFHSYEKPFSEYTNYEALEAEAKGAPNGFETLKGFADPFNNTNIIINDFNKKGN